MEGRTLTTQRGSCTMGGGTANPRGRLHGGGHEAGVDWLFTGRRRPEGLRLWHRLREGGPTGIDLDEKEG